MPGQSYGLEDGSCSYKDFSESRNNRFSTPEQAAKNRIQHPSNVLHFFNAPLEVTEENFFEVGAAELVPRHRHLRRPSVFLFFNKYLSSSHSPGLWVGCRTHVRDQGRLRTAQNTYQQWSLLCSLRLWQARVAAHLP